MKVTPSQTQNLQMMVMKISENWSWYVTALHHNTSNMSKNKQLNWPLICVKKSVFYWGQDECEWIFSVLRRHIGVEADVQRTICPLTDRESRLLLYGCYQTAHHDFFQLTARYLHTSPPVAMVIETGVSSDGPTTDIRAALKQTAAGGGDLLSPCLKSIWTITSP